MALRGEVLELARGLVARPFRPSPVLIYLVAATVVSAAVAFPLLLTLSELSSALGGGAMLVVGAAMLVTGAVQLRRPVVGTRTRDDARAVDGIFAGVAQGVAVVPGLSRSGLTVAVLLARRLEGREALTLSFLMSVPASLGAALYVAVSSTVEIGTEAAVAAVVAFGVGLVTIRLLLGLAGTGQLLRLRVRGRRRDGGRRPLGPAPVTVCEEPPFMTTIRRFADDVLATLQQHLAPAEVTFHGSLLSGDADEYSDVDLANAGSPSAGRRVLRLPGSMPHGAVR